MPSECLDLPLLPRLESTMSFTTSTISALQAISKELSGFDEPSQSNFESDANMPGQLNNHLAALSLSVKLPLAIPVDNRMSDHEIAAVKSGAWKQFSKATPFLAIPPELHFKIMSYLHPIDATCYSLINSYIYRLSPPFLRRTHYSLDIGSPSSTYPNPQPHGCKHCCPVLYSPHHCELHYHLRRFMPKELKYCSASCKKYTYHETDGKNDSEQYCGTCGISYRKRYERGRRMLDVMRPGEKQLRLSRWFNDACK